MAKVKICDAMMGDGKTSAAIQYMLQRYDKRFLFITPYLDECDRIKDQCKARHFTVPWRSEKTKFENLHDVLASKQNVASTHAMMHRFNDDTIQLIKDGHYVLILDEVFDVLNVTEISDGDIQFLKDTGAIKIRSDGIVSWEYKEYDGEIFEDFRRMCDSGLVFASSGDILMWQFPISVFEAFDEVIVLTYQFDSQIQRAYFDINGIDYEYIGVHKNKKGKFEFCAAEEGESQQRNYRDLIHILDSEKLNRPGDARSALSISWVRRERCGDKKNLRTIHNAMENLRKYIWRYKADSLLWTCAKEHVAAFLYNRIDGDKKYLAWNYRATNEYRTKQHLFYLHNVFLNPNILLYLHGFGVDIDERQYALTSLIQWIWRSAIRDGKEVWLYIPSARMRGLLKQWLGLKLNDVEQEAVYGKFRSAA